MIKKLDNYIFFVRVNLIQIVHVEINSSERILNFKFETQPYLFPCEVRTTKLRQRVSLY
jgi:hypothetical protein